VVLWLEKKAGRRGGGKRASPERGKKSHKEWLENCGKGGNRLLHVKKSGGVQGKKKRGRGMLEKGNLFPEALKRSLFKRKCVQGRWGDDDRKKFVFSTTVEFGRGEERKNID